MSWRIAIAILLLSAGCYRVRVFAEPATAKVTFSNGVSGTGAEQVRVHPFSRRTVTVTAGSHRPQTLRVRWSPTGWVHRDHDIEVRLVEDHGPAGSIR